MSGVFITFEGGEGVGKTTQIPMLADRLAAAGLEVVRLREPGGTPMGDRVREVLLDPDGSVAAPWAEVFLYEACRAELAAVHIAPAVERGAAVICDRYSDSTLAYQGHGRGLDLDALRSLNALAGGTVATPDATVLLDLDVAEGLRRATVHGADRLEAAGIAFHERVREGFLALAAAEPDRFVVVDASGPADAVAARVWDALSSHPALARATGGA